MRASVVADAAIEKIVLGNSFVTPKALEATRAFRDQHHADKDIAEVLFLKGHLTRSRLAMVRRLVKMNRRGDSASMARVDPTVARSAAATVKVDSVALSGPKRLTHCGRYEILEKIARGGMGVVYKARHPELDKVFAVKVLSEGADAHSEVIERFRREAKAAARLDDPGIVRVYDFGTEAGFPYLVMDYIEGRALEEVVRDEGVTPRYAAQLTLRLALALHHAHDQGLVHRDIKPSNVLIDTEGRCKLTDFGIVKELGADERLTRTGFTLGSPCYMSPEQARGDHEGVDCRSDVYSLGATLYEMLCGEPPFSGDSIPIIMNKVLDEQPRSPQERNAGVPTELALICLKSLEKDPGRRYATARSFGEDLQAFLDGEPISAQAPSLRMLARRFVRRHKYAAALTGFATLSVCALCLVLVGASRAAQGRRDREARGRAEAARALLTSVTAVTPRVEVRRAYYKAIELFSESLRIKPGQAEVEREHALTVEGLGDRLVESGLAEFAEFVYGLNGAVGDRPELQGKIELARQRGWLDEAEAQERRGELEAAILSYKSGILKLEQLGYDTSLYAEKVAALVKLSGDRRRERRRDDLLAAAWEKVEKGQRFVALELYDEAFALGDADGEVSSKRGVLKEALRAEIDGALEGAEEALGTFEAAQREGLEAAQEARLRAARSEGDRQLREAREGLAGGALKEALALGAEARASYLRALSIARAAAAKKELREQLSSLKTELAERFAGVDLSRAQGLERRGDDRFGRGEFREALDSYERAREAYALVAASSEGQSSVAVSRERARAARARVVEALPAQLTIKALKRAAELEVEAGSTYRSKQYGVADELYARVESLYLDVLKLAPVIREAIGRRDQGRALKLRASKCWAAQYAKDLHRKGLEQLVEGEEELALERWEQGSKALKFAVVWLERACEKAEPTAQKRRRVEVMSGNVEQLRARAISESRNEGGYFQNAEDYREKGDRYRNRGFWAGAVRAYERAIAGYIRALR